VSRATGWGFHADAYFRDSGRLFLAAMIESAAGVRAIPEICRVPGLTMLFLGPGDMAAGLDLMGNYDHPEVVALMREAEKATVAGGMRLGGALVPGDSAREAFKRGFSFATVGSDVGMLRHAAVALVGEEVA
jgi:4-hydroxy-2-oxoheptanedioate aldolase